MQLILLTHLTTSGVLASQGGSPSVQTSSIGHVLDAALGACSPYCCTRQALFEPSFAHQALCEPSAHICIRFPLDRQHVRLCSNRQQGSVGLPQHTGFCYHTLLPLWQAVWQLLPPGGFAASGSSAGGATLWPMAGFSAMMASQPVVALQPV